MIKQAEQDCHPHVWTKFPNLLTFHDLQAKGKKRRASTAKKEELEPIPESRLKVTETSPTEYLRSAIFAQVWNDVISSMREEDIISNQ